MDIELINSFCFKCLSCNTGITFELPHPTETAKMVELSNAVNNLTCPRCGTSLSTEASKAFDVIKKHNGTAFELQCFSDILKLD